LSSQSQGTTSKDFEERLASVMTSIPNSSNSCVSLKDIPSALAELGMTVSKDQVEALFRRLEIQTKESFSLGGHFFWQLRVSPADLLSLVELLNSSSDMNPSATKAQTSLEAGEDTSRVQASPGVSEDTSRDPSSCASSRISPRMNDASTAPEKQEECPLNLDLTHCRSDNLKFGADFRIPSERSLPTAPACSLVQVGSRDSSGDLLQATSSWCLPGHPLLKTIYSEQLFTSVDSTPRNLDYVQGLASQSDFSSVCSKRIDIKPNLVKLKSFKSKAKKASKRFRRRRVQRMIAPILDNPFSRRPSGGGHDPKHSQDKETKAHTPKEPLKEMKDTSLNCEQKSSGSYGGEESDNSGTPLIKSPSQVLSVLRKENIRSLSADLGLHSSMGFTEYGHEEAKGNGSDVASPKASSNSVKSGILVSRPATERKPRTQQHWSSNQSLTSEAQKVSSSCSRPPSVNSIPWKQKSRLFTKMQQLSSDESDLTEEKKTIPASRRKVAITASSKVFPTSSSAENIEFSSDPTEAKLLLVVSKFGSAENYLRIARKTRAWCLSTAGALLFLIIAFLAGLCGKPQQDLFFFSNSARIRSLQQSLSTDRPRSWPELQLKSQVLDFLEGPFISQLLEANSFSASFSLLGKVRIRQIRSKYVSCANSKLESLYPNLSCIANLGKDWRHEDRSTPPKWKASNITIPFQNHVNPFQWTKLTEHSGFSVLLGSDVTSSRRIMESLRKMSWFDDQTRLIYVEYAFANVNKGFIGQAQLISRFPISGGVVTSSEFLVQKTVLGVNTLHISELLFLILVVLNTLYEIRRIAILKYAYFCPWKYVCQTRFRAVEGEQGCMKVMKCECCKLLLHSPAETDTGLKLCREDQEKVRNLNADKTPVTCSESFKKKEQRALWYVFSTKNEMLYRNARYLQPVSMKKDTWKCLGCKAEYSGVWKDHKNSCQVLNARLMDRIKYSLGLKPRRSFSHVAWNYLSLLIILFSWGTIIYSAVFSNIVYHRLNEYRGNQQNLKFFDLLDAFYCALCAERFLVVVWGLLCVDFLQKLFKLFSGVRIFFYLRFLFSKAPVLVLSIVGIVLSFSVALSVCYGSKGAEFSNPLKAAETLIAVVLREGLNTSLQTEFQDTVGPFLLIFAVALIFIWVLLLVLSVAVEASNTCLVTARGALSKKPLRAFLLLHTPTELIDYIQSVKEFWGFCISNDPENVFSQPKNRDPEVGVRVASPPHQSKLPPSAQPQRPESRSRLKDLASNFSSVNNTLARDENSVQDMLDLPLQELQVLHKRILYSLQEKIDNHAFRGDCLSDFC